MIEKSPPRVGGSDSICHTATEAHKATTCVVHLYVQADTIGPPTWLQQNALQHWGKARRPRPPRTI
jgi:hypothetical protein